MARQFGDTWWGLAWVDALEQRAAGDDGRLSRGRTYARKGHVEMVEVLPGHVKAVVLGNEDYRTDVSVRPLDDQRWDQVIDLIVGRAAHSAALLTGELPPALLHECEEIGVALLPIATDLVPDCSCPDWGDPCKHAAALCYLITDLIDADPFTVLLLRGRSRPELLDEIRRRRADGTVPEVAGSPVIGMAAEKAWSRDLVTLPRVPVPSRPHPPVVIRHRPPVDSGVDLASLKLLASDAAVRAWGVIDHDAGSGLGDSPVVDGARRAANSARDIDLLNDIADALSIGTDELASLAVAWRIGGASGVMVANEPWAPDPTLLAPAKAVMPIPARTLENTITSGDNQLRLDPDGLWWRFERHRSLGWVLSSTGHRSPGTALSADP